MSHGYIRETPTFTVIQVASFVAWTFVACYEYPSLHASSSSERLLVVLAVLNALLIAGNCARDWISYWIWRRAWIKVYGEDPQVVKLREEKSFYDRMANFRETP